MALPDYSNHGFYDPGQDYIGGQNAQMPSALRNAYGTDQAPEAAYYTHLQKLGLGGSGSRARTAQALFGKFKTGYEAAKMNKNFELFFPEYLDTVNVNRVMGSLSNEGQGLDDQRYQGRYRWGMRG